MRKRFFLIILYLYFFSFVIYGQKILGGPYLADMTSHSIVIRWVSEKKNEFKVIYGEPQKVHKASFIKSVPGGFLYEARLTGLTPDKKYDYKILLGKTKLAQSFFTCVSKHRPGYTVVVMGDSRSHTDVFSQIMKQIDTIHPDAIISMGDLVEEGGVGRQWAEQFFSAADDVIDHIPFISALGDHEGDSDKGRLFRDFFFPKLNLNQLWYSFDIGNIHFVALDYRHPESKAMAAWFKKDMQAHPSQWKIVFMHRPCYNLGGHRSMWGKRTWPKLFRKFKVDFVFAGHSHIYERFYPVRPSGTKEWPVTYITTGGAGAGLYEINKSPFLAKAKSIHHYIVMQVQGNQLTMTVYSLNGKVIDKLYLTKKLSGYDRNYSRLIKPQEQLDAVMMFLHAVSDSLTSVPLYSVPAKRIIELESIKNVGDIPFRIFLSRESVGHYKMEPFEWVLRRNEKLTVPLKIFSLGEMQVSEWGDIKPALKLECIFKLKGKTFTVRSGNLGYWPVE